MNLSNLLGAVMQSGLNLTPEVTRHIGQMVGLQPV
jgi:hypothetical protein